MLPTAQKVRARRRRTRPLPRHATRRVAPRSGMGLLTLLLSAGEGISVAFVPGLGQTTTFVPSKALQENAISDDSRAACKHGELGLPPWSPTSEAQVLRTLAERIKFLRWSTGWTQEQLAERSSIQRSYLADLEQGHRNPSVRTLVKVANAIGIPISSLFVESAKSSISRSTRRKRL